MDPSKFKPSTVLLNHNVYPAISRGALQNANANKLAVVTGAGRGIGRAIAEALAASGANVALLDLNLQSLEDTKNACENLGSRVGAYQCNVCDGPRVQEVFQSIRKDLGPIDVLVNNAGKSPARPLSMETFDQFWNTIEVNFKGAMQCIFQVLPEMRERRSGSIISIASRAATVDAPFCVGYDAGKAALVRAISTIQTELEMDGLGEQISMYALHPGGVMTAMGGARFDPDVLERYPWLEETAKDFGKLFKDDPTLCGSTCAYLATGKGRNLRGCYFDCRQDIERVCGVGRETLEAYGLYTLKVEFLQGYENEP
ncbi:3-oxoacyl-reductase [Exophiala viscosa]|uniref:3-oxoacyl-reductase n=1 Tax=Exophiala viscosa TaxID=2486360 RepID=A0AAN6DR93_9EURO|nr:3-oxoacyl-reductase [Exophiala viscosa]